MPEGSAANGTTTPLSSKMSGLALTEYTAAPTPPSERTEHKPPGLSPKMGVPEDFLLPNGYPDVRFSDFLQFDTDLTRGLVSSTDLDVTGLRCH